MKRVLIIHNFYRTSSPSGEDRYVLMESKSLEENGYVVERFYRYSDSIPKMSAVRRALAYISIPFNLGIFFEIRSVLKQFNPDVIHIHNIFPLISPSVYLFCLGRPIVTTLHNYRYFCSGGVLMRDNEPCTKCIDGSRINGVIHRCYRGSYLASGLLFLFSLSLTILSPWKAQRSKVLAFTKFQRSLLVKSNIALSSIKIKPNFTQTSASTRVHAKKSGVNSLQVVYVGRLSPEKGIRQLVEQWCSMEDRPYYKLSIVGDGPERKEIERLISAHDNVTTLGYLPGERCKSMIASCDVVIMPSLCFEGFPTTLLDAFAANTTSLVSNIGPLPELVEFGEVGYVYDPTDAESLVKQLDQINVDLVAGNFKCRAAREVFEKKYSELTNINNLGHIYRRLT